MPQDEQNRLVFSILLNAARDVTKPQTIPEFEEAVAHLRMLVETIDAKKKAREQT